MNPNPPKSTPTIPGPDGDFKRLKEAAFKASMIDANLQSLTSAVREKAPGFFDSVGRKAKAIAATIIQTNRCTDAQMEALDNLLHGLRRWTHGDDA